MPAKSHGCGASIGAYDAWALTRSRLMVVAQRSLDVQLLIEPLAWSEKLFSREDISSVFTRREVLVPDTLAWRKKGLVEVFSSGKKQARSARVSFDLCKLPLN